MRAYILFVVLSSIFTLSLTTGCRTNPRTQRETALLRAEILDLEDQYYAMKSRYESAIRQLRECRGEPVDAPIDGLTGSEMSNNGPIVDCLDCDSEIVIYDSGTSYRQPHAGQATDAPGFQPQSMDSFRDVTPPNSIERDPNTDPPTSNLEQLPPAEGQNSQSRNDDLFELDWGVDNSQTGSDVRSVAIQPTNTFAANIDGRRGDDGLVLTVQTQNANATPVSASGQLIVEIVDPTADRNHRRIGRWEFTRQELSLFASHADEPGYILHLPWDRNIPRSNRMRVLVRFITADGNRFDSSREFRLTPPGDDYSPNDPAIAEWTQQSGNPPANKGRVRRGVNAIPTSSGTRIQRPRWRPVR